MRLTADMTAAVFDVREEDSAVVGETGIRRSKYIFESVCSNTIFVSMLALPFRSEGSQFWCSI